MNTFIMQSNGAVMMNWTPMRTQTGKFLCNILFLPVPLRETEDFYYTKAQKCPYCIYGLLIGPFINISD